MRRWTRRQFVRTAALGGLGVLVGACATRSGETLQPFATDTAAAPTSIPTQVGAGPLTNENRPAINRNWNVRYFRPYTPVDRSLWRLTVEGLAAEPQSFSLGDLLALPRLEQDTRMKCVECWSARAVFTGFAYAALAEVVRPLPAAAWVTFECADGYYESLSIAELSHPRTLFAYGMDGELLPDEFGAPLRLVAPPKYGYKWPKAIIRLQFSAQQELGYWPTVGPYSPDGAVQPGYDSPLDDPGQTHPIAGGEITEY